MMGLAPLAAKIAVSDALLKNLSSAYDYRFGNSGLSAAPFYFTDLTRIPVCDTYLYVDGEAVEVTSWKGGVLSVRRGKMIPFTVLPQRSYPWEQANG